MRKIYLTILLVTNFSWAQDPLFKEEKYLADYLKTAHHADMVMIGDPTTAENVIKMKIKLDYLSGVPRIDPSYSNILKRYETDPSSGSKQVFDKSNTINNLFDQTIRDRSYNPENANIKPYYEIKNDKFHIKEYVLEDAKQVKKRWRVITDLSNQDPSRLQSILANSGYPNSPVLVDEKSIGEIFKKTANYKLHSMHWDPNPTPSWLGEAIDEAYPKAAPELKHHYLSSALKQDFRDKTQMAEFLKNKEFSTEELMQKIQSSEKSISQLSQELKKNHIASEIYLSNDFIDGSWHPASNMKVYLKVKDKKALEALHLQNPRLDISIGQNNRAGWAKLPEEASLLDIYNEAILKNGSLAFNKNSDGSVSYTKIGTSKLENVSPGPHLSSNTDIPLGQSYRKEPTRNFDLESLQKKVRDVYGDNIEVKLSTIDDIHGDIHPEIIPQMNGNKAQVTVQIDQWMLEDKFQIDVIERKANHLILENGKKENFEKWADTYQKAKKGDLEAIEQLARIDVEFEKKEVATNLKQNQGYRSSYFQEKLDYAQFRMDQAKMTRIAGEKFKMKNRPDQLVPGGLACLPSNNCNCFYKVMDGLLK